MKIRCIIDCVTLHGMPLSPAERVHLERVLHQQLDAALRAGWTGAQSEAPSFPQQLWIDLPPQKSGMPLGHSLGQSLGAALSPAGAASDGRA